MSLFQDAVMVGLHTCGDLAPSTLRMFEAKQELQAVCSVGCCYHLLSEEFDEDAQGECTPSYSHTHTQLIPIMRHCSYFRSQVAAIQ